MRHSARLEAKGIPNLSAPAESHTPPLISPPGTKTPPTDPAKREHAQENQHVATRARSSTPLDIDAVTARLQQQQQHAESRRQRETTPGESPKRKKPRVYSDRMIPNRIGQDLKASYSLMHDDGSPATPSKYHSRPPPSELHIQKTEEANRLHSNILRREMFDDTIPQSSMRGPENSFARSRTPPSAFGKSPSTPHKNLFNYSSPAHAMTPRSISRSERGPNIDVRSDLYSLSPVKHSSQRMLLSPRKAPRAVSKVPYKVLDAPELADDFYLNLVDWGSTNVLAVGLGDSVYLWNSESGKVDQLVKLEGEQVTSVGWIQRGSHLAVGTSRGMITVFDTVTKRRLRQMTGHTLRVSSMAWNQHILSTGSRDRTILHRDVRSPDQYFRKLVGHKQEICGLRWNHDTNQLASGGNDNKVFVWDGVDESWLYRWGEAEGGHKAAVKAVAWSPHTRGLLATGGGTADRCIKFWNTVTTNQHSANSALAASHARSGSINTVNFGAPATSNLSEPETSPLPLNPNLIRSHDTGSQVCNLMFSTLTSEIVSTHGYSQNAINVWKYPSMTQVVSLTGHTYRVLYLSMSPGGDTIVTGAGDETLRFWDVFGGKAKEKRESSMSSLVKEWGMIR
ncbi:WD40 repeat-like protein [Myriangium duriaei CBS 260.36]|uniref:WD40 repeat-like protein n=1 Tax=Myriangium duriaei CBS 260.36 TaxID=1168546 RepID=A0A9P4J7I4_9PEZI|nr:WD40 repeat-like protein [Myriangium duriaei CBS 260.36]